MLAIYFKKTDSTSYPRANFPRFERTRRFEAPVSHWPLPKKYKGEEAMISDGDRVKVVPTNELGTVVIASQSGVCYVRIDGAFKIKAVNFYDVKRIES